MLFNLLILILSIQKAELRHLSVHGEIEFVMEEENHLNLFPIEKEIRLNQNENQPNFNLMEEKLESTVYQEWIQFQKKHNKEYSKQDLEHRFEIFRKNYDFIKNHNLKYDLGEVSFSLEINEFADMDEKEFDSKYKGLKNVRIDDNDFVNFYKNVESDLPSEIDWREMNVVGPVKNQGQCGSCYAFSAIGNLESMYAIKYKKLVNYSEQNLVDCSYNFGNGGCQGGLPSKCFNYIINNHGLDTEEQYPYVAHNQNCKYVKNPLNAKSQVRISIGNEKALQHAVSKVGPISVGIDASPYFQFYKGGVLNDTLCTTFMLNHGVVVVGYGTENSVDYWLVRNSWGPKWGEHGYIKMSRNAENQCGISTDARYIVL